MPALDLVELATRASDGAEVDWESAERSAGTPDELRIVRRLRAIGDIARWHSADPETEAATAGGAWGELELRGRLGEGSFGEVHLAWDPKLEREVALKLLKRGDATRILEEGRLLARVRHPNVVAVYGVDRHDDRVGLWMERVEGRSLEEIVRDHGPLGAREAASIGIDLCRALAAVHGAGLVHRDVKAANVLRERRGRIVLMDFGAGEATSVARSAYSGTPVYTAPEIWDGARATPRSDVWSVGVLLHYLLTGEYPVRAAGLERLKEALRRGELRLLRDARPDLPEALLRAVEGALETDPERRTATAGALERALSAALGAGAGAAAAPARRSPARRLLVGATIAAGVVALIAGFLQVRDDAPGTGPDAAPYTVDAAAGRPGADGAWNRLGPGDVVAVGDRVGIELEASRDLFVYVLNRDERGQAYVLFPLPDLDLQNPLPGGVRHRLPGTADGRRRWWSVTSAGGREHLLVLASPVRQVEFEAELARLPRPAPGAAAQALPDLAEVRVRAIGGTVDGGPEPATLPADRLFDLAEGLAGEAETVRGAWVRRIVLENP